MRGSRNGWADSVASSRGENGLNTGENGSNTDKNVWKEWIKNDTSGKNDYESEWIWLQILIDHKPLICIDIIVSQLGTYFIHKAFTYIICKST